MAADDLSDAIADTAGTPVISVIIPVYNDAGRLRLCLSALAQQQDAAPCHVPPFEVIVIDNGSTDDIASVRDAFPDVVWTAERTAGSYNARNHGLTLARGTILAFTDSDCIPDSGWLAQAAAALADNPALSFIGGGVDMLTTDRLTSAELFDLAVGFPQQHFVEHVHFAMTANMVTTRAVMDRIGAFNGGLKSGGDREWGNRAWHGVGPGRFVAAARVSHPTRSTPPEVLKRIRRVAGGERDRYPGWGRCLAFCAKNLLPPRRAWLDILAIDAGVASPAAKLAAMLFAYRARLVLIRERLILQVGQGESARS